MSQAVVVTLFHLFKCSDATGMQKPSTRISGWQTAWEPGLTDHVTKTFVLLPLKGAIKAQNPAGCKRCHTQVR